MSRTHSSSSSVAPWEPVPEPSVPDAEVAAALARLWTSLDEQLSGPAASCRACGECCDFQRRGHVLFATKAELDVCLDWARRHLTPAPQEYRRRLTAGRCPFQDGRLCLVHPARPLGCRIYYCCDEDAALVERVSADAHHELRQALRAKELLQWYGPALAYIEAAMPLLCEPI
ncbi:MAG: YkgJ family cysteine cluster protein [Planctomycetes bacterium]|nr:YkgJ family cysteine cluster protein [Planctomycetota bacterium]